MEHKGYVRICDGAKTAILFVHGIVGTPNHFIDFVSLVPNSISVYNLLLDGHGKGAKDFSRSSMKKWEAQVFATVESLGRAHEKIIIVAHSMGTLLAVEQAIKNKKVCKLFLLAVPLRITVKFKMITNLLKVYFGKISEKDYLALAAQRSCGIKIDKNPFNYIGWIPRYIELFSKIRKIRGEVKNLNLPCFVYQSGRDEMISRKSVKYLNANSFIIVKGLQNSGHYYYAKNDLDFLFSEFKQMLSEEV